MKKIILTLIILIQSVYAIDVSLCDTYKKGSNYFKVDNGIIKKYSDISLNLTNNGTNDVVITSAILYNGSDVVDILDGNKTVSSNDILKLSAEYLEDTQYSDNYWIIKLTDMQDNKKYIVKYEYDSFANIGSF